MICCRNQRLTHCHLKADTITGLMLDGGFFYMSMTIIPNQYFGHGDIHFCITLVNRIADGRKIVWPCLPHFVDGLNRAFPHITFVDWRTMQIDFERRDQYEFEHPTLGRCTVLPIRWTTENMRVPYNDCMRSKYEYWGINYEDWRDDAMWVRDKKEAYLYGMTEDGYLINKTFGSDCKLTVKIPELSGPGAIMSVKKGYSLFDWAAVIENAKEIHTVNSSIIYLLELLDLKAPEIHLYQRSIPGQTFDNIKYLLKRHKYIFHP